MYIKNNNLVITGDFVDMPIFDKYNKIIVDADEAYAANVMWVNDTILMAEGFPKTQKAIEDLGYKTLLLNNSEFKKIDGSVTCLSLRFKPII